MLDQIIKDRHVSENEMGQIQQLILDRENFKTEAYHWFCTRKCNKSCLCYDDKEIRLKNLFKKGYKRVEKDLDLRTYMKNVRNV